MTSRRNMTMLLLGIVALAVLLAVVFSKPAVDWNSHYRYDDGHPYGVSFIRDLLEERSGGEFRILEHSFDAAFVEWDSLESKTRAWGYVYIGKERSFSGAELEALLRFADRGNSVLIAAESASTSLLDTLTGGACRTWQPEYVFEETADTTVFDPLFEGDDDLAGTDTSGYWIYNYTGRWRTHTVAASFSYPEWRSDSGYVFHSYYRSDTVHANWTYWLSECVSAGRGGADILGIIDVDRPNFIRFLYGEGAIYLHTNPELFANVNLLEPTGLAYAEGVFSRMKEGGILWDTYELKRPVWQPDDLRTRNPLSYILSEPPLRRALYLILAGAALFILFRAKRRQRIIPIVAPNVNDSLEYAEMLGQLFYEKQNHAYMAGLMWQQFNDYLRTHYSINPTGDPETWMARLAVKSSVDENRIRGIDHAYRKALIQPCTEPDLMNLYNKIYFFYTNSK